MSEHTPPLGRAEELSMINKALLKAAKEYLGYDHAPTRREEIKVKAKALVVKWNEENATPFKFPSLSAMIEQFALDVWNEAISECASISVQRACGPDCHLSNVEKAIRSLKAKGEK